MLLSVSLSRDAFHVLRSFSLSLFPLAQANNLNCTQDPATSEAKKEDEDPPRKPIIVRLYERYPWLKQREDYSLFIFPPENSYVA